MPDWNDPQLLDAQSVAFQRMTLVFIGICLYDFASSIPFDWKLVASTEVQRSLLGRSVKWVYLICRYCSIATCAEFAALVCARGNIHCTALIKMINSTARIGVICGTTLLFVRVCAIWEWNKKIVGLYIAACLANLALSVRSTIDVQSHLEDRPTGPICSISAAELDAWSTFLSVVSDIVLLLLLFAGLWRWSGLRGARIFQLIRDQGLVSLTVAIGLQIPMATLLFLNYNEYMNMYFTTLNSMLIPMVTTYCYRSLISFAKESVMYTDELSHPQTLHLPRVPRGFRMSVHTSEGENI
ncbi:unnamed protein product [Peniophora sp. CBMAI 1063]|nr:unnamed protein product [Peniophora sp. CBMAI 1063]